MLMMMMKISMWNLKMWFIWHFLFWWYAAAADSRDLICIAEFRILDIYIKDATTSFACISFEIYYLRQIKDSKVEYIKFWDSKDKV